MHAKKANEIACQNFDQSELKSLRGDKVSGWDTLRMKARAFKARFLGTHLTHGFRMLRHSVTQPLTLSPLNDFNSDWSKF